MFNKSVCILLSGKAGVGKTTCATYIAEKARTDLTISKSAFALGLKEIAVRSFNWDGNKDERGRKLLQDLGRTGRAYNENIWVSYVFERFLPASKYYPFDLVLVDDWRFPNEYEYVKAHLLYHVYTVNIRAPDREILRGTEAYLDSSETALDNFDSFDFVIDNSGSFVDLYPQLDSLLDKIIKENTFGGLK